MGMTTAKRPTSIVYFDSEGRQNLPQVLRIVRRAVNKRPDLASLKIVVFTALGEGPVLAYNLLQEFHPKIIAVTFPPEFSVKQKGTDEMYYPRIPPKLQAFFDGVRIKVITGRLPFDSIEGVEGHNDRMKLIKSVLDIFGGGFSLSVQAVLSACDSGELCPGEQVISITGDSAAIVTAATTTQFLAKVGGLAINEILCKPRNLTLARKTLQLQPPENGVGPRGITSKASKTVLLPKPPTNDLS
jgi:hypothetical protein